MLESRRGQTWFLTRNFRTHLRGTTLAHMKLTHLPLGEACFWRLRS